MEVIEVKTLIDITNTNVRRAGQGEQLQFNQYRNWTTLLQCIGMRAIIEYDRDPYVEMIDISNMNFGKQYSGIHRVWTFYFRPDQSFAFSYNNDPIFFLKQDLNNVPIISNLTETINIHSALFDLNSVEFCNTLVKAL
jgi:hypothetical protein